MKISVQAPIEQFTLANAAGTSTFTISVSRPAGLPDEAKDVPVLIVLDGDIEFGLAAEIARLRGLLGAQATAIVVGVGYGASEFAEFAKLRTADLTPPTSEASKAALGNLTDFIGDKDGGADAFLTFLADTLGAELSRRYPEASATNRILFGHSLGGLFVAHALLSRPDAFAAFLSISPSLWWDGFAILALLPGLSEKLTASRRKPRAFIGVGAKEQDVPEAVPPGLDMALADVQALVAASRMVDAAAEFAESLRGAGIKDVGFVAFDGEDHGSVLAPALGRSLAFALKAGDD